MEKPLAIWRQGGFRGVGGTPDRVEIAARLRGALRGAARETERAGLSHFELSATTIHPAAAPGVPRTVFASRIDCIRDRPCLPCVYASGSLPSDRCRYLADGAAAR